MTPTPQEKLHRLADRVLPIAIVALFGGWFLSNAVPASPGPDGIDYVALGQIPVHESGRVMPLETLASTSLQAISGITEVQDEHRTRQATAMQWLVKVMDASSWDGGAGASMKVFRIDNDQLLASLELPRRPGFYRYSLEEILQSPDRLEREFDRVREKRRSGRPLDLIDAKVEELGNKLERYQKLARNAVPQAVPPGSGHDDWVTLASIDDTFRPSEEQMKAVEDRAMGALEGDLMRKYKSPDLIPDDVRKRLKSTYNRYLMREVHLLTRTHREKVNPAAGALSRLLQAARDGKSAEFNAELAEYQSKYLSNVPQAERDNAKLEAEVLGEFAPFYNAAFLYIFVLILAAVGWLVWTGPLNRSAYYLAVFAFSVHTLALIVRMYVQGRPPVTNLYASAVFIGWGAVGLCLVLERVFKNGIGNFVAGVTGAATLGIAHFLGGSGDTMALLQAVLDTNFWLAIHVTTVTLGYTATLVAGMISVHYLITGVCTTSMTPAKDKTEGQMIYGVACFATLLSFFGTVAGGIWADYSWGRFWGWDPKENGAVMIVIWNCLVLHARWAGLVKNRGMAMLAVGGNMITAWSWFGTNQLQIGLHSYGFDNGLAKGCRWFWYSQLAIIALGLIPRQYWRSATRLANPEPVAKPKGPERKKA